MIFTRKEVKEYGTKKLIEGSYHSGQYAVIIDDVITNGESKLETIRPLEAEGLIVKDVVVLVDRGQGGPRLLSKAGFRCHTIYSMEEVFEILLKFKRVDSKLINVSKRFMAKSKRHFLKK